MKMTRQVGLLLAVAVLPALLRAAFLWRQPNWATPNAVGSLINLTELNQWSSTILWVDARSAEAYSRGHVPGAVLLNEEHWDELFIRLVETWQPGMRIVVYCDNEQCNSSRAIAVRLRRELGVDGVFALNGGWQAWRETLKN